MLVCLNGPLQGLAVEEPKFGAKPGMAVALPWQTPAGAKRFAVYLTTAPDAVPEQPGAGLMYLRSYDRPQYAAQKVRLLTIGATMLGNPQLRA